jgi:F-type H+-transporting ATPase subunit epsilon
MADQLTLEVVTPEKIALRATADEVIVPAYDGLRGILPGHEPLVTNLRLGELSYQKGGRAHSMVIGTGLLEVRNDVVNVLVESAQKPEEIDVAALESARRAAGERLHRIDEATDYQKAQSELERTEIYLQVAGKR